MISRMASLLSVILVGCGPGASIEPQPSSPLPAPKRWIVDQYGDGYAIEDWIEAGRPGLDAGVRCYERAPAGDMEVPCP